MITRPEAEFLFKRYKDCKNKVVLQHKIDEALFPLNSDEFEIAQLMLYGAITYKNSKEHRADKMSKYKFYKVRKLVIDLFCLNIEREDFENVFTEVYGR